MVDITGSDMLSLDHDVIYPDDYNERGEALRKALEAKSPLLSWDVASVTQAAMRGIPCDHFYIITECEVNGQLLMTAERVGIEFVEEFEDGVGHIVRRTGAAIGDAIVSWEREAEIAWT